jgi:hypothetical protein
VNPDFHSSWYHGDYGSCHSCDAMHDGYGKQNAGYRLCDRDRPEKKLELSPLRCEDDGFGGGTATTKAPALQPDVPAYAPSRPSGLAAVPAAPAA